MRRSTRGGCSCEGDPATRPLLAAPVKLSVQSVPLGEKLSRRFCRSSTHDAMQLMEDVQTRQVPPRAVVLVEHDREVMVLVHGLPLLFRDADRAARGP